MGGNRNEHPQKAFKNFFIEGVENFADRVLFIAGECQMIIGADWQREQMAFFPYAELMVIPDAGYAMFADNPEDSVAAVREYLNEKQ